MKPGNWIVAALLLAGICHAEDLMQQYEKAYYLETAKGRTKEAAAVYQKIAEADANAGNQEAIKKSLLRLLHISTKRKHAPTIRDCQEKLLSKTGITIQELIEQAGAGTTIYIPAGEFEGRIVLKKDITLKGLGETSVIQATSDEPLVLVNKKVKATLEGLTLKARKETSERTDPPHCAVYVKDAKATLNNCSVIAPDSNPRCPLGVYAVGFAEIHLFGSRFEGHIYPIFYGEGSEGSVKGCTVLNPGDCGFMSHAGSEVTIEQNVFTGSAKHGVRSTGGTIYVKNNLIIKNRNRGIYLGNKTAHGEIINNAIIENGSGISTFASADPEIQHNVILGNGYSGIDTRTSGRIQVKRNIIADNKKTGFAVYEEGSHQFKFGENTVYGNGQPSIDFNLPKSTIQADPKFADAENGDFTAGSSEVKSAGHGLTDPSAISTLWKKYKEATR